MCASCALLDELRAVKNPAQIESLRDAYVATVASIREAFLATCLGDTEADVAGRIQTELAARGATNFEFNIVVIGERSPWAHPPPPDRRLGEGEILRVDVGATFGLYTADVGRTAAGGRWTPECRAAFDGMARVRQKVIPTISVGDTFGEVYARFMDLYPKFDLPRPPLHTLLIGHSIGIEVHEQPILSPGETSVVKPGMVLNIEPDVRSGGLCLTHECAFLMTDAGLEPLAEPDEDPLVIDER